MKIVFGKTVFDMAYYTYYTIQQWCISTRGVK